MKVQPALIKLVFESPRKSVIAIDGYSGAGKTTLLKQLARQNGDVLPVFIDDFMNTGKVRRARLQAARDKTKVMELEWNNVKKIRQLVRAFRTRNGQYKIKVYNPTTDRYDRAKTFNLSKKF